jgi:cysteine desulfurase
MQPYFIEAFANADSVYEEGRKSSYALDDARRKIANLIGAKPEEIYFTSGGSESDNWAIKGVAFANKNKGNHIITTAIEHPAVMNTCKWLQENGYTVTYLPVNSNGVVSKSDLENAIKDDTILVSIMSVNNEVGAIQNIKELALVARERGVYFHTDAVQALGYENINVGETGVDLLSLSAHKFFGPKGIGILYVKKSVCIEKLIHGGHQERSMRGGTSNVPLAVGMACAMDSALKNASENPNKTRMIRDYFEELITSQIPEIKINCRESRVAHNSSVTFRGVEASVLLFRLDMEGVFASAGSACSSGSVEPSHVLKAIGLTDEEAKSTLRFSFSHKTTKEEVVLAVEKIKTCILSLRN